MPLRFALIIRILVLGLLMGLCGCGQPTPVTQIRSAVALEKSFTVAVDGLQFLPIEKRRQLAPAVNAGNAILDQLHAKIGDGTKPLSATDFAQIAAEVAPYLETIVTARRDQDRDSAPQASAPQDLVAPNAGPEDAPSPPPPPGTP